MWKNSFWIYVYLETFCDEPVQIEGAILISETSSQNAVGSKVTYTCDGGFQFSSGLSSLTVECLSSGRWSVKPDEACQRE